MVACSARRSRRPVRRCRRCDAGGVGATESSWRASGRLFCAAVEAAGAALPRAWAASARLNPRGGRVVACSARRSVRRCRGCDAGEDATRARMRRCRVSERVVTLGSRRSHPTKCTREVQQPAKCSSPRSAAVREVQQSAKCTTPRSAPAKYTTPGRELAGAVHPAGRPHREPPREVQHPAGRARRRGRGASPRARANLSAGEGCAGESQGQTPPRLLTSSRTLAAAAGSRAQSRS